MMKPMTSTAAITSRPIISIEAISSPKPRCEARAASPRPAARPASGPIHERLGCACGAAAAVGALAVPGAASADLFVVVESRCMPEDLPAPKRLPAASASPTVSVKPRARMAASKEKVFMVVL
jgi:hypothetical protein